MGIKINKIMKKIKNALISVSEKTDLKSILEIITKYKINVISSGGTYKRIKNLGFKCRIVKFY